MAHRFPFRLLRTMPPAGDPVPDAELLRRFARDRDPAALELVVRRHADAVWAVCRRVGRSAADAEDAFQATFLVLARKAGSVRGASAGGWLHRVAVNAALKVRAGGGTPPGPRASGPPPTRAGRRPAARDDAAGDPTLAVEADELAAVVQEEVARLPDRYRLPVVLCDLEGQSHAEAAKALGWPVGSVSGRLSRARGLLRDRLARRGYGAAPLLLAPAGGFPPRLIPATTAALSGATPVPPSVSLAAQGVLSAMRTARLQLTAVVVASAGLLGLAGAGAYTALAQDKGAKATADPPAPPPKAEPGGTGEWILKDLAGAVPTAFPDLGPPPKPEEDCPRLFGKEPIVVDARDDTYRKLLKARLQLARLGFARTHGYLGQRGAPAGTIVRSQMQLLGEIREVVVELWAAEPAGSVPWLEESVRMTKLYDGTVDAALQAVNPGDATFFHLVEVRRHRLAAEADLWKAKNRSAAKGGGPGR